MLLGEHHLHLYGHFRTLKSRNAQLGVVKPEMLESQTRSLPPPARCSCDTIRTRQIILVAKFDGCRKEGRPDGRQESYPKTTTPPCEDFICKQKKKKRATFKGISTYEWKHMAP